MSGLTRKGGLFAAAAMALCASVPAQATMGCWNETQVAAAKVRDLQSRLMVATMRCRAMGVDITDAYNRFVVANRATIQGANGVILAQFRSGFGGDAQLHYDRFATSLANAYGGDETDPWICAETEEIAYEAAAARGEIGRLVALADSLGLPPSLPGGRCDISFEVEAVTPPTAGFDEVDAIPPPAADYDGADATPVPGDRWDEIESIPPPAGDIDQAEAAAVAAPEPTLPPVRAPAKVEAKTDLRHDI